MKRYITLILGLQLSFFILAAEVTLSHKSGTLPIVSSKVTAQFVVAPNDAEVVSTAAAAVAGDIRLITDVEPAIVHSISRGTPCIIAGTLGQSTLIDSLVAASVVDVKAITGKWEAYTLQLTRDGLVIVGSTPRGTAYGLFHLSRLMGVSPWVWWADVLPEKHPQLFVSGKKTTVGEPSVKFRGLFINDEDWGLQPWAAKKMDADIHDIGPNTYAKVCELLLRLRANLLWPGMHPCTRAFWHYKENPKVAARYDIVLGTSHCEPMLRNNVDEWDKGFIEEFGEKPGDFNYATNKAQVQKYWEARVREARNQDAIYTIGMRGVHDGGIQGYSSTADKVAGLTEIFAFQRGLLAKYHGDATRVPQLFIPYKEVLNAYNAGLQVPDDVTLCWVDDNHGFIRQLPNVKEQQRKGGHGVYYHLSYWGSPEDYLWLSTISPELASYELTKAYELGVRNQWIINVGDIKPAEMEFQFCMDLAWDTQQWAPQNAHRYARHWAAETFGEEFADDIADIKAEYYRLAAGGKPEHVSLVTYSDEEMNERIADYKEIADKADALYARMPERLRDAFFQLVLYPVQGAFHMNVKVFRARQSLDLAAAGQHDKALQYASEAQSAFEAIKSLTADYNHLGNGKWDGIMSWKPRNRKHFNMPAVATVDNMAAESREIARPQVTILDGGDFKKASRNVKKLEGLGLGGNSAAVWPLDMKSYSEAEIASAPYADYEIPLTQGENTIEVRCLPDFPLYAGHTLRYAISIDGGTPEFVSIQAAATSAPWNKNVLRGFAGGSHSVTSPKVRKVRVRIYFPDPALVVSQLRIR